jgi:NADH:ubiquinone oxidoreductase subunit
MTITTRLHTFFYGKLIGEDQFGNRYFVEKTPLANRRAKRWVLYNGKAEASKVPPEWHGWLHYTLDTPPNQRSMPHYSWQKPHLPNLTGTTGAYVPPGHLLRGGQREKTTADYEAWKP